MKANGVLQGATLALALMALSIFLAWAGRAGVVAGDIPTRVAMAFSGLVIAFYGNAIPKVLVRSGRALAVRRLAGWAFVLSGLASAVLWALAPLDLALPASTALVGASVLLGLGACVVSRMAPPAV